MIKKWPQILLIFAALLIGLVFRLYKLDSPVADWHSHRQADTASVTRLFIQNGIDFLHPKYHDLSNVQSGQRNPQGYRMVEAPIYNVISVYFHQIFKTSPEVSSRLVSIIFSLGSALLIYLICFQQTRLFQPSFFAMAIFLFLPFNIYYSRTILPEPSAIFFMLLTLFTFRTNIFISAAAFAVTLLIKPFPGFIIFPALLLLAYRQKSFLSLVIFSLISLVPFFLWRRWIDQFPEGIPSSDWLLNNGVSTTFPLWFHGYNLSFLNKLVAFRPHWWYWLFDVRIAQLILGTYGIVALILGFAYKKNKTQIFTFCLALGILFYFIIVAQGNIQHDYYQVIIIPSLSIISGFGYFYITQYLFSSKTIGYLTAAILFSFSLYFSYNQIHGYYQINNYAIVSAGQKAAVLLPPDSLVIAPYKGDTAFLYQTGFRGWPTQVYNIDQKVKLFSPRKLYLISVNFDQYTNSLIPKYKTIFKTDDYIILQLSP